MKYLPTIIIFFILILAGCQQPEQKVSNSIQQVKSNVHQHHSGDASHKITKRWTQQQKSDMNRDFYDWFAKRAKKTNHAVTPLFYTHTKHTIGDWYALTPDGDIQIQDNNMPGYFAFDHHVIGGLSMYTSNKGITGKTNEIYKYISTTNYKKVAKPNTQVQKYILVDNGNVYELIADVSEIDFCSGFVPMDDYGKEQPISKKKMKFKRVSDNQMIEQWDKILHEYEKD